MCKFGGGWLSIIWRVLYLGWVAGEIVIAIGTRRRSHAKQSQDRGTQVLLWFVIVLSLTAAGFLEALVPASFRWHAAWLRPLSLILMIFGIAVRAAAIATLGRWFTANVVTQPEQQLPRGGLYGLVRHPSYLGMEIIFVAIGLHSRAWPAIIVAGCLPPSQCSIAFALRKQLWYMRSARAISNIVVQPSDWFQECTKHVNV